MRTIFKFLTLSAVLTALALPAHATVTLSIEAEDLLVGGANTSNVPVGSLVLLVADTTGNGFASLAPGNISTGAEFGLSDNDLILAQLAITAPLAFNASHGENVLKSSAAYTLAGNWDAGDPLAIYWIPSLNAGATNVGLNVAYGEYTDSSASDGSAAWITPSDGSSITLLFSTTGVFGNGSKCSRQHGLCFIPYDQRGHTRAVHVWPVWRRIRFGPCLRPPP